MQIESISPLEQFNPNAHFLHKKTEKTFHLPLEGYRDLVSALKAIPPIDPEDPRLPSSIKKENPQSFSVMLDNIEFILGQLLYGWRRQGVTVNITVEVRHNLWICVAARQYKYEIAKINDDSYLVHTYSDPNG